MAKLAQALLRHFPEQYGYFSTRSFKFRGRNYRNHNNLLKNFEGTDGIKTGYTHASGYNLVASAVRGDRRLIGVVFGGKTSRSRDRHMRKLLGTSFNKAARPRIEPLDQPPPRKPLLLNAKLPTTSEPAGTARQAAVQPPQPEVPVSKDASTASLGGSAFPMPVRRPSPVPNPPAPNQIPMRLDNQVEQGSTAIGNAKQDRESSAAIEPQFKPLAANLDPSAKSLGDPASHWGVQVGAYRRFASAHLAAQKAARHATQHLVAGRVAIRPIKAVTGEVFRARITGVTEQNARLACDKLKKAKISCHVVPPNGG